MTGKGVMKALKAHNPQANIVAVDYDPGASEVNQVNRIKLMMSVAFANLKGEQPPELPDELPADCSCHSCVAATKTEK